MSLPAYRLRRLPVNQDDRASCRGQLAGDDQPGQASADDDDIAIHVTIFVPLGYGPALGCPAVTVVRARVSVAPSGVTTAGPLDFCLRVGGGQHDRARLGTRRRLRRSVRPADRTSGAEAKVYSEIVSHTAPVAEIVARRPKAIILSGGPQSVYAPGAPWTPASSTPTYRLWGSVTAFKPWLGRWAATSPVPD